MADKYNFYIDAGTDFEVVFNVDNETSEDLAIFTPTAKMKKHHLSSDNNAISFVCSINTLANTVTLSMNNYTTSNISPGRYVYDVKLTSSANSMLRLVEGMITVNPKVS